MICSAAKHIASICRRKYDRMLTIKHGSRESTGAERNARVIRVESGSALSQPELSVAAAGS